MFNICKRSILATCGVIALACASVANATATPPPMLECKGCDQVDMETLAQENGAGFYYIYDVNANTIRYIHIKSINDQNTQFLTLELTVPTTVYNDFETYHGLYVQNGHSETFHASGSTAIRGTFVNGSGHPTDNGFINAYDTVAFSAANNQVMIELNNDLLTGMTGFSASVLTIVKSSIADLQGLTIIVAVTFPDGSTRTYKWNKDTQSYAPIPNTAIDAHFNTIPEGKPSGSQNYSFTNGVGVSGATYDQYNIESIFNVQAGSMAGSCSSLSFDGTNLKCIHPF